MKDAMTLRVSKIRKERLIFLRVHQGYSQKKIAALLEVGTTTVRKLLKRYKIDQHSTEALMQRQRRSREIVRMYKTGEYSCNKLVEHLDISLKVIYTALREADVFPSPAYRNRLIKKLYSEGVSISDLAARFGVTRCVIVDHALKGVSKAAEPRPSKPGRTCAICKTVYKKNRLARTTCSYGCARKVQFLSNCERYLAIRKRRRAGDFAFDIGVDFGLPATRVLTICRKGTSRGNPWGEVLEAIERVCRHKGKGWLSGFAKVEQRSALKLLETEGLLDALQRQGVI